MRMRHTVDAYAAIMGATPPAPAAETTDPVQPNAYPENARLTGAPVPARTDVAPTPDGLLVDDCAACGVEGELLTYTGTAGCVGLCPACLTVAKREAGADLAASRAVGAEHAKRSALRVASEALAACGLLICVESLYGGERIAADGLDAARHHARALRSRLRDGSDEARYEAAGEALTALGALWALS